MNVDLLTASVEVARHDLGEAPVESASVTGGVLVACADGQIVSLGIDGSMRRRLRVDQAVRALCALPVGFAVATDGGLVVQSRGVDEFIGTPAPVRAVTRGAEEIVYGVGTCVSTPTGATIDAGVGTVLDLGPLRGGRLLAVAGTRGLAWLDIGGGSVEGRIELSTLLTVVPSHDGELVAAGSLDGVVHVLQAWAGEGSELEGYPDRVRCVQWVRDESGQQAVLAVADDEITVWRVQGRRCSESPVCLRGHDASVTRLAVSPDGEFVASGDSEGVVRLWRPLRVDEPLARWPHHDTITTLRWAATGSSLVIGDRSGVCSVIAISRGAVA